MIVAFEIKHAILQTYKKKLLKKERRMLIQQASFLLIRNNPLLKKIKGSRLRITIEHFLF